MSDRPIVWRRVSQGLYLMSFGVLLLLSTQGHLRWSFWHEALSFWPVLLVGLGIRVVFERTRLPWLVLLSPVVVIGALIAIAVHGPAQPREPRSWTPVHIERPEGAEEWSLTGRWHDAKLDLRTRPLEDALAEGRRAPVDTGSVRVFSTDGVVKVTVGNRHRGPQWVFPRRHGAWELALDDSLPLALDLELSLTEGRLDLSGATVSGFELEGALNDLTLRLGRPLEDVTLDLSGAFNDLELELPATVPVSVRTDGPLNRVERRSDVSLEEGPGYKVYVDGAFNRLTVTTAQPLELERAH